MNQVFDVYSHISKGQWGFSASGSEVWTAEIKPGGSLKLERIESIKLGAQLTKRVRMGFTRMTRSKYLHQDMTPQGEVVGEFSEVHPDVHSAMGYSLVLMVTKPFAKPEQSQIEEWETTLQSVGGISDRTTVWLKRQEAAQQYFTAFDEHPAFALVLSEWALRNKQILLCNKGTVPMVPPIRDPMGWKQFLSGWFTEADVQKALEQLGWSLRDALLQPAATDNNNLADDADSWIAEAGQAAF